MSEFSVIIPTLQRSDELHPLVEQCAAHPLVLEVLVINNAPEPLHWASPKVRVLQQAENIYVNPAWNLGAREARGEYLAILNDDIEMEPAVFDAVARILRRGWFSMVGPAASCMVSEGGRIRHRPGSLRTEPFGTAMFLRKADYEPIPESMRIWGGDDWLIYNQARPIAKLVGARFRTDMSVTSASPEFAEMRRREYQEYLRVCRPLLRRKAWHWPASLMARASSPA